MFDSLYVHVPFCNIKCDYCAFYSIGHATAQSMEAYLQRIEEDFKLRSKQCNPLRSIFIGGGTPTTLPDDLFQRLLALIDTYFSKTPTCEWTSEANPESLTENKIKLLAEAGVNRVSIGVQSFNQQERDAIGRKGSIKNLKNTVHTLRQNNIRNVNFDLMFLLPGQTPDSFAASLQAALELEPTHVSAYALTLEEKTPLARRIRQPDDQDFQLFWDTADHVLGKAGLERYEISNFSKPDHHCRHNDDVWHGYTYLGCGPSATSFDGTDRFTQSHSLKQWLQHEPPEIDRITTTQRACEILAFGMRTLKGWNFDDFHRRFGAHPMELKQNELRYLADQQLITLTNNEAKPTKLGLIFNDDILEALI